jgi:predicted nucleic acid-binding protein
MASLIDTDVMIDVSRGSASAASYLDGLGTFDSLIAATAIRQGFELVSKNRKHFTMIAGLRLESPRY